MKTKYISEEPFLVLHHINAFEMMGQIVIDLVAYPDAEIVNKLFLEKVTLNSF